MATIGLPLTAEPPLLPLPPTFQDLYREHSATVYRTALRVTGNAADAEDVLQTVFLRLLNQNGINAGLEENYLRRAATNASIDIIRKRQSHKESDIENASAAPSPSSIPRTPNSSSSAIWTATAMTNSPTCFISSAAPSPAACIAFAKTF